VFGLGLMIGFLRVDRRVLVSFLFVDLFFVRGNVLLESFEPFVDFVFRMRLLVLGLACRIFLFLFQLDLHRNLLGAFCVRLIG